MSLKVTLADIARKLNTTAATVSRALNGDPSISEKMKQKIRDTARRMHYKPNKIASSLRRGHSGIIGVIIPSAEINFFGSVVHGIETLANTNGYNVLIYQSNESQETEIKGIETFLSARVDGILVSIAKETTNYSHFTAAKESGIPIIFFDRSKDKLGIHSVVIDDFKGAYLATSHLIAQGYKRIAHISGPQHLAIFKNRLKGYKKALKDAGIPIHEEYIIKGNVSVESGRSATVQLLQLKKKPDAVFAVEDFTALGVIKELKEHLIRIPEDFGVIGFANESFGEYITPALSTMDQQTVEMGKHSFELLMKLMNNEISGHKEHKIVLEPLPVLRESSMRKKIVR